MAERKYRFVSIIMFILCPDTLSLNGSVMINKSINQSGWYGMPSFEPSSLWDYYR